MPGKSTEVFVEDASPSKVGTHKDLAVRVPDEQLQRMQLCVRAADMRARHMSFQAIAVELGLSSPAVAKTAYEKGLALQPTENLQTLRRVHGMRLDRAARVALEIIAAPGPLVSQGKVIYDEATGEPCPDQTVRNQALQTLIKVEAEERKFYGTDAAKRSVTLSGEIPAEYLQEQLARLRSQLGITEDGALQVLEGAALPPG